MRMLERKQHRILKMKLNSVIIKEFDEISAIRYSHEHDDSKTPLNNISVLLFRLKVFTILRYSFHL